MKSKYDTVLFDLDGTISESAIGITSSVKYTFEQLGLPVPDLSDVSKYVGPPLMQSFTEVWGLDEKTAALGCEIYRKRYKEKGVFENRLYPDIANVLKTLHENGVKTVVATSKYEPFAEQIANSLGISQYLSAVCGSNLSGTRKEKADIIRYAAERVGQSLDGRILMIGDTLFDAIGADQTGVDFLGVTYGYGEKGSLSAYNTVDSAAEILNLILG